MYELSCFLPFQSFVAELAETFVSEIAPTDEVLVKLQQCCHRWLQTDDIVHYNELKHNLLIAVKDAIIYKMQNPSRKKRNVGMFVLYRFCTPLDSYRRVTT